MHKKLITVCMTVVAFAAFIFPTAASATNDPDLTFQKGTLAAPGLKIQGTNVGDLLMTDSSGNVITRCTKATMTGEVVVNTGTSVEGPISSVSFSGIEAEGKCASTFAGPIAVTTNVGNGVPWCLRSNSTMATDEFQVRGNSCTLASRSITFVLDITNIGACKYARASAITGKFTTEPEDAVLVFSGSEFTKEEGSILCPSAGRLDLSFTLEKDGTTEPIYIS